MGQLGRTPSRKHRRGRRRRQAPPTAGWCNRPARSAAIANGILTAVIERLRYLGAYEVIDAVVAGRVSSPRGIRLVAGEAWGENWSRARPTSSPARDAAHDR